MICTKSPYNNKPPATPSPQNTTTPIPTHKAGPKAKWSRSPFFLVASKTPA